MIGLVLLAIQAAAGEPAADQPGSLYRALGVQPAWSVAIGRGQMRFEALGQPSFTVPTPRPRTTVNGYRLETASLTIDVVRAACADESSDRRYLDTVVVRANGRTYRGCGGGQAADPGLVGTNWSIVAIGQEAVSGGAYVLRIGAAEIGGRVGCNTFSARYTMDGDMLTVAAATSTRMACAPAIMTREQRAFAILSGRVRVSRPDANSLVLAGDEGVIRLRRTP
ncbi:MAG: META domain-containing protein [Sphingomonas sp.]